MISSVQLIWKWAALALVLLCPGAALALSSPDYVEGDVLVTFKPSVDLASSQKVLAGHSLALKSHFSELSRHLGKHSGLIHDSHRTTAELVAELSLDPAVERAEPNHIRTFNSLPNDTLFTNLWALRNQGQWVNGSTGVAGADIRFVPAWKLARPNPNPVVVAVMDSGVDYTHPDLAANMWTNPGEIPGNGLDDDKNGYVDDYYGYDFAGHQPDPMDSGFHGTHVAGIIAATGNNQSGIIGVDYQAQIMALRISTNGTNLSVSAEIGGLQYATQMKSRGVNLVAINASFGGNNYNYTEQSAIQAAGNAGIIFCAAAGNSTNNNDFTPHYPASYRLPNMIVVAASDQNDALTDFSDYGANTVDLAAPGDNILSLLPVSQAITNMDTHVESGPTRYPATALIYSGTTPGITATAYYCGLGYPTNFPPEVQNNIALIARGTLYFSNKVANAMAAGARAVIIYNNTNVNLTPTLSYTANWIPSVFLSQSDGLALQSQLPATVKVVNTPAPGPPQIYQYLSGTSMAAPQVTAAVAFAAQNFPYESVAQRIQRILGNVDVLPSLAGKVRTGGRLNLQRIVDTDLNGLPDWWEQQYFGQPTGTDPNADPDNDGLSNLAEWLAGTAPTDPTSNLQLTVSVTNPNAAVLNWPSVPGKDYRLERSTNLATGFDTLVGTNISATAPTNTITDTGTLPGKAFYRVGIELDN